MGAGCSKRAAPDAAPESPAPVVKLMRASADQDASGTINRQEFEKFVTPIGSWSAAREKQIFDEADEDKDGELCAAEIEKSFRINENSWPGLADTQWSEEELQQFMSCCDSDGDGVISQSELAEFHRNLDKNNDGAISSDELAHATDIAQQKFVEGLFASGDTDGNAVLDQSEFSKIVGKLVGEMSDPQLLHLFQSADADGDGNVSAEEFRGLVNKLDRNGDGKLSWEELQLELDKDGSGMLASAAASTALGALKVLGPLAADLAPENMKFACQAVVGLSTACLKGDSVISAATKVATDAGTRALISKARRYVLQKVQAAAQPTMSQAGGSAAAAATAGATLPAGARQLEPGEPEHPRSCFVCKRGDLGMCPLRCCDTLICGKCIGTMIGAKLPCPRCRQPSQQTFWGAVVWSKKQSKTHLSCLAVRSCLS